MIYHLNEKLKSATEERQVEDAYNELLYKMFHEIKISYPFKCDGHFELPLCNQGVLIEYKYDEDFSNRVEMVKVVIQVLFYLKRFERGGKKFPAVIMIADKNECFVFHSNVLLKYLEFSGVDWNLAPSNAGCSCSELTLELSNDNNFNPFVFKIDHYFDSDILKSKIEDLATNTIRLVKITEHNIDKIFKTFTEQVFTDKKKISAHDLVGVFLGCICDKGNYYLHPGKKNTLVTSLGEFKVNSLKFEAFFKFFSNEVSPKEKLRITEICDRLIEDTERRRHGDFFTPTPFVDYAHKMITEWLGENWKDEYVVWDCCAGTLNLTRDYRFRELYCSTLFQSELDAAKSYNPEAVKFQFDFLNDPLEKAPEGLLNTLKTGKKILFFINPPYGKATSLNGRQDTGMAKTKINEEMVSFGYDIISSVLYCQVLYRIQKIKKNFGINDCKLAVFCNPTFITSRSSKKFRKTFLKEFSYYKAILFNAGNFGDVSGNWGISFSLWNSGETEDKQVFNHIKVNYDGERISECGMKELYNLDNQISGDEWAFNINEKNFSFEKTFQMKTALTIVKQPLKEFTSSIGCMSVHANDQINQNRVFLCSHVCKLPHFIYSENFNRAMSYFVARKIIPDDWITDKDQVVAPDTTNPSYDEFSNDSIVYSLFHSSSNQSSLRQIDYKGKKWDIKNEFFWMGKNEIMDLADENNLDETYSDARTSENRFVFKKLQNLTLSPEAQAVLDKANELVRKSFKYRSLFNDSHPEYQILNWDCGFYQLKPIWKEFLPDDFKEFKELYKRLADKMRPMVYELGFLKK